MKTFGIPEKFLKMIFDQAQKEYPTECCGMILGPEGREGEYSRLRACRNAQEEYHAQDPKNFPRDSRTAYFIDPQELLQIQKELRASREAIRVIYHSHIEAAAYFSEEDKRMALWAGRPVYPGVDYLIVSVKSGAVQEYRLFRWDLNLRKFIQAENQ